MTSVEKANSVHCFFNEQMENDEQLYMEVIALHMEAEQGDMKAQQQLGVRYEAGRGVEQNYEEAVKWYRKAVEQEDDEAEYRLGNCYYEGKGGGEKL